MAPVLEPPSLYERAGLKVFDVDRYDLSELFLVEQLFRVSDRRHEAVGETHHVRLRVLFVRFEQLRYALVCRAERLFDVDRLSGAYDVGRHRNVKVVRRADLNGVDLRAGDEIMIIGESALRRDVQPVPRGVQSVGVDVADGGDDGVRAAGETAGVCP